MGSVPFIRFDTNIYSSGRVIERIKKSERIGFFFKNSTAKVEGNQDMLSKQEEIQIATRLCRIKEADRKYAKRKERKMNGMKQLSDSSCRSCKKCKETFHFPTDKFQRLLVRFLFNFSTTFSPYCSKPPKYVHTYFHHDSEFYSTARLTDK